MRVLLFLLVSLAACSAASPMLRSESPPPLHHEGPPPEQLDKRDIVEGMSGVKLAVQHCFERFRETGMWTASLTVLNSGQVRDVDVKGPSPGTATGACIAAEVSAAQFRPFTGAPQNIVYPYVLR